MAYSAGRLVPAVGLGTGSFVAAGPGGVAVLGRRLRISDSRAPLGPTAARVIKAANNGSHGGATTDPTVLIEEAHHLVGRLRRP
jgi:hypothetical protein